ncbi:MAG TPA: histidine phosphatase family protein [Rhodanobacteraceae bacterium]|jgi:phosphohistidine phosphatase SixA|nr:histidine phosphatase family protein [Rhodanobacteraceae bacterium]
MRELLLLRHAEAMSAGPDGRDIERPLSLRGERQARAVGEWLADQPSPDAVLCSAARRAQMTCDELSRFARIPSARLLPDIYRASPGELLSLVEAHAPQARRAMIVGHNPGLEQLLALLTEGRSDAARGLTPATLAWIAFDEDALEPGRGRLHALWTP